MGPPGKHVHIRRPYRLPMAAAPTLIGLAAAGLCLSAQAAPAGAATVTATAQHAVAAVHTDSSSARLMSVTRNAAAHKAHVAHVAHVAHKARVAVQTSPKVARVVTYSGSGSFQSCVIARESGGNSQVMNSSGHYGLYQFSYATWVAYGGSPSTFGHASVAQQNQVFNNAIAAGGQSNWAPYDGC
jgi:Transglycosylase-like domain